MSTNRSSPGIARSRISRPRTTWWDRCGPASGVAFCWAIRFARRMDCPATVQASASSRDKWPGTIAKLIEDKANGSAVIQMLDYEIPGLLPVNPQGGKIARAQAISPLSKPATFTCRTRSTRLG